MYEKNIELMIHADDGRPGQQLIIMRQTILFIKASLNHDGPNLFNCYGKKG